MRTFTKSMLAVAVLTTFGAANAATYSTNTALTDKIFTENITAIGSVRISVSGEVIPGAAQRGCPLFFVMQYARPDAIARVV